jgi:hypothetical protein
LFRLSGLGFLVTGLVLIALPICTISAQGLGIAVALPVISLFYCGGLYYFNFQLYRRTGADTPRKGTLYAMVMILVAFVLSQLGGSPG